MKARLHLYRLDQGKPRHRQLKRLILAVRDMSVARKALEKAEALKEDDGTFQFLIAAAIIAYARSFSAGRTGGVISSKWAQFEQPGMAGFHREICDYRDKLVAHNDDEMNEVEFLPPGTIIEFKPEGATKAVRLKVQAPGEHLMSKEFSRDVIAPFLQLVDTQKARIGATVKNQKEALFSEFRKPSKRSESEHSER